MGNLHDATAVAAEVRAGKRSARALAAEALERAERSALGAFWALDADRALRSAEQVDAGDAGPLSGVTVAVKDCFDLAGLPTTSGSPATGPPRPRMPRRCAGFAAPGACRSGRRRWTSSRGRPSPSRRPGGLSSGSAAAVAGDLAALGLGTDIAGSIRIPASCCGLVGLKPPPGWIPLAGATAFAPGFDCAGVLARSLRDCVTAVELLGQRRIPASPTGPARVGLLEGELELSHPEVAEAVRRAARTLGEAGTEVLPVRLGLPGLVPGMGKILAAELLRTWGAEVKLAPELYDDEVHGSIAYAGRLSDDDCARARAELERWRRALEAELTGYTAVLGPTMRFAAPSAEHPGTVAEMTAATRPFNALGWAALSLPGGSDGSGRPIGVHLAAPPANLGAFVQVAALLSD